MADDGLAMAGDGRRLANLISAGGDLIGGGGRIGDSITVEGEKSTRVPWKNAWRGAEYDALYKKSIADPDSFWADIASQFYWKSKWEAKDGKIHKENFGVRKGPIAVEWFKGGKTNICHNAVDRNVESKGDDIALIWEGNEPGYDSKLTFRQLKDAVCRVANYLCSLGVGKGDAVVIYMPMLVELPVAMLACARIGAVHSNQNSGGGAGGAVLLELDAWEGTVLDLAWREVPI
ncbi:unnamed protein product [Calypogeia fissa]